MKSRRPKKQVRYPAFCPTYHLPPTPFFSTTFPLSTRNSLCFLYHSRFAAEFSTAVLCFHGHSRVVRRVLKNLFLSFRHRNRHCVRIDPGNFPPFLCCSEHSRSWIWASDAASKETCSPPTLSTCQVTIDYTSLLSHACQGTCSPLRSAAGSFPLSHGQPAPARPGSRSWPRARKQDYGRGRSRQFCKSRLNSLQ